MPTSHWVATAPPYVIQLSLEIGGVYVCPGSSSRVQYSNEATLEQSNSWDEHHAGAKHSTLLRKTAAASRSVQPLRTAAPYSETFTHFEQP